MRRRWLLLFVAPGFAVSAWAHDVARIVEAQVAPALGWSFDPWTGVPLVASALLYALGVARLWRRAGRGRGIGYAQLAMFVAGWVALALALLSPIETWGSYSFSAHMIQHELLMAVGAPLMVLSRPLAAWTWALSADGRRGAGRGVRQPAFAALWRFLTAPLPAWCLHAVALWAWHAPAMFNAALVNDAAHTLQHTCFLVTALFYWWTVLGRDARIAPGVPILSLLTTMIHTGLLSALITFAPAVWYPAYLTRAPLLGLDPLVDQQLGGLIMWVPAGAAYMLAALALALRWLHPLPHTRAAVRAQPGG